MELYNFESIDVYLTYGIYGFIILGFLLYFIIILLGRIKNFNGSSGFDITKDILSLYDKINIIEGNSVFSVYNLKRRVIRLAKKSYYGTDMSSIGSSLMEAGVSLVDNMKNSFINLIRVVVPNLKVLYILPLIMIIINSSIFHAADAKIFVFIMFIVMVINYFVYDTRYSGCCLIDERLSCIESINKSDKEKIISYFKKLLLCDKLILFGELLIVVRCILILFMK